MATSQAFIINQTKISEQVYEYLHGEITSGRLAPGQRLDLEHWSSDSKSLKYRSKKSSRA
jgi:DNA-binding GntR family transcriptional regulator